MSYNPITDITTTIEIRAGSSSSAPGAGISTFKRHYVEFDDGTGSGAALYFDANNGTDGTELYKSDGLTASLAYNINPGSGNSSPKGLTVFQGNLYFSALHPSLGGNELWVYKGDGTGGAVRVADINLGTTGSNPGSTLGSIIVYDPPGALPEALYFQANDGSGIGIELWHLDPTDPMGGPFGTVKLAADINTTTTGSIIDISSAPNKFIEFQGELYFSVIDTGPPGPAVHWDLWTFDGTNAVQFRASNNSEPSDVFVFDDGTGEELFFLETDGDGKELWQWDGTRARQVRDINVGSGSAAPNFFTVAPFDGQMYFGAESGPNGRSLWRTTLCGNGTVDAGEVCDGANLDGETCVSLSFPPGVLSCGASCTAFDVSGCIPPDEDGDGVNDDVDNCAPNSAACPFTGAAGPTHPCYNPGSPQSNIDKVDEDLAGAPNLGDVCDPCPLTHPNTCDPAGSASQYVDDATGTTTPLTADVPDGALSGFPDGNPDGSVSLTIPPDCLMSDTTISIQYDGLAPGITLGEDDGFGNISNVFGFTFEPDGLMFNGDPPCTSPGVSLTFGWIDALPFGADGVVDDTFALEPNLIIGKDIGLPGEMILSQGPFSFGPLCSNNLKDFNAFPPPDSLCDPDEFIPEPSDNTFTVYAVPGFSVISLVSVSTPANSLKAMAIEDLEELRDDIDAGVSGVKDPDKAVEHLNQAIPNLEASITSFDPALPNHVLVETGEDFFDYELEALKFLIFDTVKNGGIKNVDIMTRIVDIATMIVEADRIVAGFAIEDAQDTPGADQGKIDAAIEKFEKAEEAQTAGLAKADKALMKYAAGKAKKGANLIQDAGDHWDDAIGEYKSAWKEAQAAVGAL